MNYVKNNFISNKNTNDNGSDNLFHLIIFEQKKINEISIQKVFFWSIRISINKFIRLYCTINSHKKPFAFIFKNLYKKNIFFNDLDFFL